MPLNFGKVMQKLDEQVRQAGAEIPDWLCLSDHTSRWKMDVYLAVDQDLRVCGGSTPFSLIHFSKNVMVRPSDG